MEHSKHICVHYFFQSSINLQSHTAEWISQDEKPGFMTPSLIVFPVHHTDSYYQDFIFFFFLDSDSPYKHLRWEEGLSFQSYLSATQKV